MYKVIFLGVNGLLGSNFARIYKDHNFIEGTYFKNKKVTNHKNLRLHQLDIRNRGKVFKIIKNTPADTVVHAAAIGDVDYSEKNKRVAYRTNVIGTRNIADACLKLNKRLIFLSSNAIYNGKRPPFSERSKPNPINYYGMTKLEGEKYIINTSQQFMILRLNTMYGWPQKGERGNPATSFIEKLQKNEEISVVDDIYNNHLYVVSAANVLNEVILNWQNREVFNIAGRDCTSRYDFAKKIAKVLGKQSRQIKRVNSSYFPSLAPRPKNTCYNTGKMQRKLKCKPVPVLVGLKDMIYNKPY